MPCGFSHPASHPELQANKMTGRCPAHGSFLEGQAGREDILDQRGCWHEILQPEVEDALQSWTLSVLSSGSWVRMRLK
ncbi:hypothetical protein TNCT_288731 [Trichonephila clavata]|uniref:Uncharacterized protein n=1 Tax=Trichonephila clavata TaxID=2740835 RepID=A0A8X6GVL7_TRICU|nr:hypothetical protein TNCT_288731 [Trichonephila clavata]